MAFFSSRDSVVFSKQTCSQVWWPKGKPARWICSKSRVVLSTLISEVDDPLMDVYLFIYLFNARNPAAVRGAAWSSSGYPVLEGRPAGWTSLACGPPRAGFGLPLVEGNKLYSRTTRITSLGDMSRLCLHPAEPRSPGNFNTLAAQRCPSWICL